MGSRLDALSSGGPAEIRSPTTQRSPLPRRTTTSPVKNTAGVLESRPPQRCGARGRGIRGRGRLVNLAARARHGEPSHRPSPTRIPAPPAQTTNANEEPDKNEGTGNTPAPSRTTRLDEAGSPKLRRGNHVPAGLPAVSRLGFRQWDPAKPLLAAGHLQGPARTVTIDTDHLLPLVREMYQAPGRTPRRTARGVTRRRRRPVRRRPQTPRPRARRRPPRGTRARRPMSAAPRRHPPRCRPRRRSRPR